MESSNCNIAQGNEAKYNQDFALPFILDAVAVNGRLIALTDSVSEIIFKHNYPEQISNLLSELLVFVTMLGSSLKMRGIVTAELRGDEGLVKLLVADYSFGGDIRGYCSYDSSKIISDKATFKEIIGQGYLVVTLDLGEEFERFQSVVDVRSDSLLDTLSEYMQSSQQTVTGLKITVVQRKDRHGLKWIASGLMIRKLPESAKHKIPEDIWAKLTKYMETISDEEMTLLDISPEELLYRLFHEEHVKVFDVSRIQHKCRCSRTRMENIVNSLSVEDKAAIIADEGKVEIRCQFCNQTEFFT